MSHLICICAFCQNVSRTLAHLSAFSAAQETQIEFAFIFVPHVSRCQTPSAFPDAAEMQMKTALPLSYLLLANAKPYLHL